MSGVIKIDSELRARRGQSAGRLSTREREILDLLCKGLSNRDIGMALGIEPGTVGTHLQSVYRKMPAENRTDAAVIWTERKAA